MYTLRATQRLLKRLGESSTAEPPPPTTRLGDWYANEVRVHRESYVICTSSTTLLTVLLPAKGFRWEWPSRLPQAVDEMLARLGVPDDVREREIAEMLAFGIGRTADRHINGVVTDLCKHLRYVVTDPEAPIDVQAFQDFAADTPFFASRRRDTVFPFDAVSKVFNLVEPLESPWKRRRRRNGLRLVDPPDIGIQ